MLGTKKLVEPNLSILYPDFYSMKIIMNIPICDTCKYSWFCQAVLTEQFTL